MLKTLGIVEASCATGRSPQTDHDSRLAMRRLRGQPLVEWVVRRVSEAQRLDGVIVVLAEDRHGEQAAELVPPDIPVFISNRSDPLGRMADAVQKYPTRAVVRVGLECPFIDPALIDGLIRTAERYRNYDYIGFCFGDGRPTALSKLGVFAEWFRAEALRRADHESSSQVDRRSVTRYLYSHPETFQLRLIPIPAQLDRSDVRLTIDGQEDWEHAEQILDALGPEGLDWQRIAGLLDQHPALRKRMASLNRGDSDL